VTGEPTPASSPVAALIGSTRTRRCEVTRRDILHFAQAIGATDPVHHDERYARTTRHGGIVAPLLFCQTLTYDDAWPDALGADGSPIELNLPIPAVRAVGGSSEYHVHRLVRPGDVIAVTSTLRSVEEKHGKSGTLFLITIDTDFRDDTGEPVAFERATYIKRP
jgi:acyl dehydratase